MSIIESTGTDLRLRPLASAGSEPLIWPRRQTFLMLAGALAAGAGAIAVSRPDRGPGGGITRGRGAWTSSGTIAVLGFSRELRTVGHGGEHVPPAAAAVAGHTWPIVLTANIALHNGLNRPLLVSPGQLRLQVGAEGPTVSPLAAGFRAGPQAAGATLTTWVSYLAPDDERPLTLQYSEPGVLAAIPLGLPVAHGHGAVR